MAPYCFRSLESDSHIRVLHLKVEASEQLSGRLIHHDLNEHPTYDCLSYVWGCDTKTHNVLLDGSPLPITLNLYNALKRMRQRGSDEEIFIWADGICINQEDTPERNQQVTLMKRIYSECRIGLLYLGEAADESDMVPEFLGTLLKSLLHLSKKTGRPSVFDFQNEFAFPHEYDPGWKRLRALLRRPWFRRVWIIQEFALPVRTEMICGRWEIPGTFLATLFIVPMWMFSQAVFISLHGEETRAAIMNHRFHLKMRHAARRDIGIDWNEYFEPSDLLSTRRLQSLVWLLDQSSSSLATDPRDKIFALIPLSSDPRDMALSVDYSKTKENLAVEVVQHFVRNGYGLSVLLAARPDISSSIIPSSWIPDWMNPRTGLEIWPMQYDEISECQIILNPDGKTITVAGVIVDVVEDRGILIGKESIFRENNKWIKDLDNLVDSIDTYPNGQRVEEALWRTLIADRSVENQSPAPEEYGNFYRMARNDHVVFDIYYSDIFAALNAIHHESDFSMAMHRSCRFSITKRRLFSLVPQDAQVGDSIFLIKGDPEKAMFLVRKDSVLGQYRWIGHAYAHGIWDILNLEDLEVHDITVV